MEMSMIKFTFLKNLNSESANLLHGSAQGKRQNLKINMYSVASLYLKGLLLFWLIHSASSMPYRFNILGHILRNIPLTK